MTFSKNGIGVVVFLLGFVGVNVAESDLATTVSTLMQIVSGLLLAWNQWERKDTKAFIFKK